jgi:hypothetical protein
VKTNRLDAVPAAPPERPTVFVVITARAVTGFSFVNGVEVKRYGGDVGGILMHADGSVGWEHMSSGLDWLATDLTSGFSERAAKLAEQYGEDLDVAIIEDWATAPEWLRERNAAWAASQTPNHTDEETARA